LLGTSFADLQKEEKEFYGAAMENILEYSMENNNNNKWRIWFLLYPQ
jgi:hypothetical protein